MSEQSQVAVLRAMARNYRDGHMWDRLDGDAVTKAAEEIERLRTELSELRAKAEAQAVPAAKVTSVCGRTAVAMMVNGAQLLPGDELCANFDALQSAPAQVASVPVAVIKKHLCTPTKPEPAYTNTVAELLVDGDTLAAGTKLYTAPPAQAARMPVAWMVAASGDKWVTLDYAHAKECAEQAEARGFKDALRPLYMATPVPAASLTTPTLNASCAPVAWRWRLIDPPQANPAWRLTESHLFAEATEGLEVQPLYTVPPEQQTASVPNGWKPVPVEPTKDWVKNMREACAYTKGACEHLIRIVLAAAPEAPKLAIPDVLFDGYAVLQELSPQAKKSTSAEQVSWVLDAVVRLIRKSGTS